MWPASITQQWVDDHRKAGCCFNVPERTATSVGCSEELAEQAQWAGYKILVQRLDSPRRRLPIDVIHEIRQYRDTIVPYLIERLDRAMHQNDEVIVLGSATLDHSLPAREFESTEAFSVILEALALPDEQPFELFGDAITREHV